jgi:hypothetical protein
LGDWDSFPRNKHQAHGELPAFKRWPDKREFVSFPVCFVEEVYTEASSSPWTFRVWIKQLQDFWAKNHEITELLRHEVWRFRV